MAEASLKELRVAVLLSDDFEQAELEKPCKALDDAGAKTTIIAPKAGVVQAMKHDEKTHKISVDMTLNQAKTEDFDAVLLPGGALNADFLRMEPKAQEFVQSFDRAKNPIAFICHALWLLISAGLVKGRTLSGYHTIQDDIRNAGGKWKDEEVVRDGNCVSSRQPDDIPAFNREMIALFAERRASAKKA